MGNKIGRPIISKYPGRPQSPWKVDIPASLAGRRIRKFFREEEHARRWLKTYIERFRSDGLRGVSAMEGDPIGPMIDRFEREKAADGHHAKKIAYWCRAMRRAWGTIPASALSVSDVERYLSNPKWSPSTRASAWRYARLCLNWLRRRDLISTNVVEKMDPVSDGDPPKEILSPAEMRHLLELTESDAEMRSFLALGAFAGLRPEEILRLDWSAVDFEDGEIHVGRHVIKRSAGARERYVKIRDTLRRALPVDVPDRGPIWTRSFSSLVRHRKKLVASMAEKFGIARWAKWPHDCLRHSYASYLLAEKEDAGYVAHQLGHNSTAMIHKHYARAVKRKSAAEWWALGSHPENIAVMKQPA